ncbi:sister chromatid cohesion protein PDS5 homolog A-like [Osmerus eperlanus]|uniref:sister chromatid cohesion protein PDS5 homolog A-like n=1 Tax=Osmerus eperlanus TaxID=29151 RepID=UPI002E1589F8
MGVLSWLQKLYIVCDVALFVIVNKSTACHLEAPKDPILPANFFLPQDKEFVNDKDYLTSDIRQMLLTGKPKPSPVLAAVNKPLTVPGRRVYTKTSDPASNTSSPQPSLPPPSRPGKLGWSWRAERGERGEPCHQASGGEEGGGGPEGDL